MAKRSKVLERLVKEDPRYDAYEFWPGEESPHWLYLAKGWKSRMDPIGCIHQGNGATVKECLMDCDPIPCDCADCTADD